MKSKQWFEVSKEGLARVIQRRGKAFALFELIGNSFDADGVKNVTVELKPLPNRPLCEVTVKDDAPAGFASLHHAFTLFGDSTKGKNPEKRGRFDLGEKLVLALCESAAIISTTGGVSFAPNGQRRSIRKRTDAGSVFVGTIRMKRDEYEDTVKKASWLIIPHGINLTFNGVGIPRREPIAVCSRVLETEIADEEGVLRSRYRNTDIALYERNGEPDAMLYEMGVPVCKAGGKYHYDVRQRVPLGLDRQSVSSYYIERIHTEALNATFERLSNEEANADWVKTATEDADCRPEATRKVFSLRFGEKAVAYDPSDAEANKLAVAKGYSVVHGGTLSSGQWQNARNANILPAAGTVTPGPKTWTGEGDPNAKPFTGWIPHEDWTPGMCAVATYAQALARQVIEREITVRFCATMHHLGAASYGPCGCLDFNLTRCGGKKWFDQASEAEVDRLLVHEFGHQKSLDHLSEDYHDALCEIAAKMRHVTVRLSTCREESAR